MGKVQAVGDGGNFRHRTGAGELPHPPFFEKALWPDPVRKKIAKEFLKEKREKRTKRENREIDKYIILGNRVYKNRIYSLIIKNA